MSSWRSCWYCVGLFSLIISIATHTNINIYIHDTFITYKHLLTELILNATPSQYVTWKADESKPIPIPCLNLHINCIQWSIEGECNINPDYMQTFCANACNTCNKQSMELRRRHYKQMLNKQTKPQTCRALVKGGKCHTYISFMQKHCNNDCEHETRCPSDKYYQSALNVADSPQPELFEKVFFNGILSNKHLTWKYDANLISFDPPIIEFHNFLPLEIIDLFLYEIDKININYLRSITKTGKLDENQNYINQISNYRTSSNAWCLRQCQQLNSTQMIFDSIEEITGINNIFYERFQILKYEMNEYFKRHSDFSDNQLDFICGPRILSLLVYLNDDFTGGETVFPKLNITVKPSKGKAILWSNVHSNNPYKRLRKTEHAGLSVVHGTKHAISAWIHLYEFKNAAKNGCVGYTDY